MLETMYVRCTHCGYDNSPEYRFCGMCGSALAHQPVATKPSLREGAQSEPSGAERPVVAERAPAERTSAERPSANGGHPENVHGPSFLGLADDPKEEFRYLYEDEPPRSYALLVVIVLLLAALGGTGYWQWRHDGFPFNRLTAESKPAPVIAPPAAVPAPSQEPQTNAPTPVANAGNAAATPDQNSSTPAAVTTPESSTPNAQAATSSEAPAADAGPAASAPQEPAPAKEEPKPARTEAAKAPKHHARAPEPKRAAPAATEAPAIPAAPDADLELAGERYLYGNGLPQNCDRAETALRTSADHGNSKAQAVLGTMYATGHCVGRDLPLAYRWFARALHQEPQNTRIAEDLSVLWRQMTPQEKQLATASGQ